MKIPIPILYSDIVFVLFFLSRFLIKFSTDDDDVFVCKYLKHDNKHRLYRRIPLTDINKNSLSIGNGKKKKFPQ